MINIFVPFLPKNNFSYEGKFFKEIIIGLDEYSKEEINLFCIEFIRSPKVNFKFINVKFLKGEGRKIWINYYLPFKPTELGLNLINMFFFIYLLICKKIKINKDSKILFLSLWRASFIYFFIRLINYKNIVIYELLGFPLEKNNSNRSFSIFVSKVFPIRKFISTSKFLQKKFKIKAKQKFLVPNITPNEYLVNYPKIFPKNFINIVWIGRLETIKRPLLALEIYNYILKNINTKTKINLTIIGSGSLKQNVLKSINYINKQNPNSKINYFNYLSPKEIILKLDESHILLHTSSHESYGMVYAEALSRNLNIITTSIGFLNDLDFKKKRSNIIFIDEIEDKKIINKAILGFKYLIRDISKGNKSRPNFNKIINKYSSKETVIKKLIDIL
ncbi:MAG: glycosyltransferase [Prochlorococcus marinus XMU1422]|nr:glycosyltransferase [Prochlorococcus marinus XMU1421]MBO7013255.1 glycosyltransferase [Prochlorococcus marinus XMU1422]MCR8542290.1 glycosyltransferase [Prochlorococcus marinus XMU1423]